MLDAAEVLGDLGVGGLLTAAQHPHRLHVAPQLPHL